MLILRANSKGVILNSNGLILTRIPYLLTLHCTPETRATPNNYFVSAIKMPPRSRLAKLAVRGNLSKATDDELLSGANDRGILMSLRSAANSELRRRGKPTSGAKTAQPDPVHIFGGIVATQSRRRRSRLHDVIAGSGASVALDTFEKAARL